MQGQQTLRRILVVDDEPAIRRLAQYNLQKSGFDPVVAADGAEGIALASDDFACALVDLRMPEADGMAVLAHFRREHPDVPVVIMSAVGQVRDAVAAMKHGAFDYLMKPFDLDELIGLVTSAARLGGALQENRTLRDATVRPGLASSFASQAPGARELARTVEKVAPLDLAVLLTGESGVGKGVLARLIHGASRRADGPLVTVSCPALPRELLESELFGYERGAFTGAHQRRVGRFEMAAGGTLFLDEIGDLPLALQPKLLNVLQDRVVQRLGSSQPFAADFRLIAATNVDLAAKVAAGEFRQDLYYRLNVVPIHVPPLRDRLEDLPALCDQILGRIADTRAGPAFTLTDAAADLLRRYTWPGNIRELENVLERTTALAEGPVIDVQDLPPGIVLTTAGRADPGAGPAAGTGSDDQPFSGTLEELEKQAILRTLAACNGNKAAAARHLGITEKTIYNKMSRLGLR
jgi:DNA-binding NtrC family response regulator